MIILIRKFGGVLVIALASDPKVGVSRPGLCHSVVSLAKKLYLHIVSLYADAGGNPAMDWHLIRGGGGALLYFWLVYATETGLCSLVGQLWAMGDFTLLGKSHILV